jgi:hypothetical protein
MSLTTEQQQYFPTAIKAVFKKLGQRNEALSYVNNNANYVDILSKLNKLSKGDFASQASAKGMQTPQSIMDESNSDSARVQEFVGYQAPVYQDIENAPQEIDQTVAVAVKELQDEVGDYNGLDVFTPQTVVGGLNQHRAYIGDASGLDVFTPQTVVGGLRQHREQIGDITVLNNFEIKTISGGLKQLSEDVVHISSVAGIDLTLETQEALGAFGSTDYRSTGTPKTITSCTLLSYSPREYTLGEVVATGDKTALGMLKAMLDCTTWANEKIDHYFTSDGTTAGCSAYLIPADHVYTECVGALELNIIKLP